MQRELGDVTYITDKEICTAVPLGRDQLHMVMGYPTSKNKKRIDNLRKHIGGTLWTYTSFPVDETYAASLGVPTDDHAFIEFNHKESINPDGLGTHSITPTGASGGAMFYLGRLDDPERLAQPARCDAKLAGISH